MREDDRTDPGEDHQGPSHTVRATKQAQPCSHGQPAKGTFLKDLARRHSLATEQPGTCPGAGSQTQTCGRRLERRPFSSTKRAGAAGCHGAASPVLLCGRRQRKKMLPRPNLGSSLPVTGKEEGGGSACSLGLLQTSTAAILQEHAP